MPPDGFGINPTYTFGGAPYGPPPVGVVPQSPGILSQILGLGGGGLGAALGGPLGIAGLGFGAISSLLSGLGNSDEERGLRIQNRVMEEQSRLNRIPAAAQIQALENMDRLMQANLPGMERIAQAQTNLAFADPFLGARPSMEALGGLIAPFLGAFQGRGAPRLMPGGGFGGFTPSEPVQLLPSEQSIRDIIGEAPTVNYTQAGLQFGTIDRLRDYILSRGATNTHEFAPFFIEETRSGKAQRALERAKQEAMARSEYADEEEDRKRVKQGGGGVGFAIPSFAMQQRAARARAGRSGF